MPTTDPRGAPELNRCQIGDCRETLRTLPDRVFQCCVTSPPYWGLRDYGHPDQIGLEETPQEYVAELVAVFAEARRVLRDDGTLWLNLGDSYSMSTKGAGGAGKQHTNAGTVVADRRWQIGPGLKPKDLCGIPWRVAFALQADGWYLRSDIVWSKPNPMPESVTDRPTKAHEYVFLLAKSERYVFEQDAVREPHSCGEWWERPQYEVKGGGNANRGDGGQPPHSASALGRNTRTVWTIATQPYDGAHFATMPPKLVERCIMAGSRIGDAVIDPFFGSGTVGQVAEALGRQWFGCELNPKYEPLIRERTAQAGLAFGGES